ncbi:MAG: SUMF1/EgtB/PvdO family nonheme iron enzyme [Pseudomonadota bacterium]
MSRYLQAIMVLILAVFGRHGLTPAQAAQEGDRIAEPYKPAVVQISTQFESGDEEAGFGFVVGKKGNWLYVVTANHVARSKRPDDGTRAVRLQFYQDLGVQAEAELLPLADTVLDLALLRIKMPTGAEIDWRQVSYCTRFERGERAWFIGREKRWFVPTDSKAGSINSSEPDLHNNIELDISSVRPGTSGAPLITREGVIGMITTDDVFSANAVAVEVIRKFAQKNLVPWNLAPCQRVAAGEELSKPETGPKEQRRMTGEERRAGTVFRDELKDGTRGPEMVVIPAGAFRMGDIQGEGNRDENPVHGVTIEQPFAMGKYPVTFAEYDLYCTQVACNRRGDEGWGRDDRPVINVSWNDAVAYAEWLSEQTGKRYRLPNEAEWEYAARAGTETAYWWGNEIGRNRANCNGCGSEWDYKKTSPVDAFKPNSFGLHDMLGNVWEWVEDCWHENYQGAPTDGSQWTSGLCEFRVFRGGAWHSRPRNVRSANRYRDRRGRRFDGVGFRLAEDL